jgi:hypothetical protein
MDDPFDHLAVIPERAATLTVRGWHQRLDPSPRGGIKHRKT